MLQEKEIDLTELSTYKPFYFINYDKSLFSFFEVRVKNTKYFLYSKENIPFITHPEEYINAKTQNVQYTYTEDLYDGLETLISSFVEAGFDEICEDVEEFIEVVTGAKCSGIFDPSADKIITSYRLADKNIRYDIYQHVIKVNKEHIKNNSLVNEVLFTLFYNKNKQVNKAVKSSLRANADNEIVTYNSFEDVLAYMNEYKKATNQQKPMSSPIIFEHIVNNESYFADKLSGLKHNIPLTAFKPFDTDDYEEGRLYFWIKENKDNFLNSKIKFLVLQDRENGRLVISRKTSIAQFNKEYNSHSYFDDLKIRPKIERFIKKRNKNAWVEISQEKIIEVLTQQDPMKVLDASPTNSIFLEENAYDIYDYMIQHWNWDTDGSQKIARSYFFSSAEDKEQWLKKALVSHKYYGEATCKKNNIQKYLDLFAKVQSRNEKYIEQKPIKEALFQDVSILKNLPPEYELTQFMKYSPLKIIEGDYEVAGDLILDSSKESLIINGDLKVEGTLYIHYEYIDGNSNNYILVLGDCFAKNYIRKGLCVLAKDMMVENITFLSSAYQVIGGQLKTKLLIHDKIDSINNESFTFNQEFSIEDKSIFQDWLFNKGTDWYKNLYEGLSKERDIFVEEITDTTTHNNNRLLQSFKRELKNWYSIYYVFAGFENLELECGDHYGHYIESDQMLNDVRQDTGYYLMSHDDYSLELVKENKPFPEKNLISTKDLAYRFFWIMWTFSTWKHRSDGPMDYWKSLEQIDTRYNIGKDHLKNDPHLALYWILHFGLLDDERFEEVKNIMQDTDNDLVKGAILFIEELKQVKTFTIEVDWDDKENTTLFAQRIKQYKSDIKKAQLSGDNILAFTFDQFKEQPNKTLLLLDELQEGAKWEEIESYLENNPYTVGFSFLFFKLEGKKKWAKLFIQEYENNAKQWESSYIANNWIETNFEDLSYLDREKALQLLFDNGFTTKGGKRLFDLREWHRAHVDKEELANDIGLYVEGINKESFTFQNLLDRSFSMDVAGIKAFINECVKQDKFSDDCGQGTICHYLVLYWIADMFNAADDEKNELAKNIVTHYGLSEKDYYLNPSIMRMSKGETRNLFKMVKKYL